MNFNMGAMQQVIQALKNEVGDMPPGPERTLKMIAIARRHYDEAKDEKDKLFWKSMLESFIKEAPATGVKMTACVCGEQHPVTPEMEIVLKQVEEKGELIEVSTPGGAWRVPRVFIAAHGLKAQELPELAKKYGWKEA